MIIIKEKKNLLFGNIIFKKSLLNSINKNLFQVGIEEIAHIPEIHYIYMKNEKVEEAILKIRKIIEQKMEGEKKEDLLKRSKL